MQKRRLGRTGLEVSVLGYGAGAVGGLFTKGAAADQERAMARAIEAGINYFDTAALYGNGESERNLGRVLQGAEGRRRRRHQVPAVGRASRRCRQGDRAGHERQPAAAWAATMSISSSCTIRWSPRMPTTSSISTSR